MMTVLSIILAALGLVVLALGAVAKHRNPSRKTEYVLFSAMDEKLLPKQIFPWANKRDYTRVRIGSRRSSNVVTVDFLQNIGITIGFISLNTGALLANGPSTGSLAVVMIASALMLVLVWRCTDWKIPQDVMNTIHL